MNIFCTLLGHTWMPVTLTPVQRWHTTKAGHTLHQAGVGEGEIRHIDRCVRCGACIVQCPLDALAFEDAGGRRIPPDEIRRFKLNLLGRRSVDAGAAR